MRISEGVTQFRPDKTESSRLLNVEKTPRFAKHKTITHREDGPNTPVANEARKRLSAFCRLNRPTAIAVIGMDEEESRVDILYHHAFHQRQIEGMLSLAVHMGEKPIADVSADLSLEPDVVRRFLAEVPLSTETAFLVLDHNGLHRNGRPDLFVEGLYLFCTRKEQP